MASARTHRLLAAMAIVLPLCWRQAAARDSTIGMCWPCECTLKTIIHLGWMCFYSLNRSLSPAAPIIQFIINLSVPPSLVPTAYNSLAVLLRGGISKIINNQCKIVFSPSVSVAPTCHLHSSKIIYVYIYVVFVKLMCVRLVVGHIDWKW
jgi:hypothetical protein